MSKQMQDIVSEELNRIAPDVGLADVDQDADLMEQFDIDSMDFLNLVTALSKRLDLPMPEKDYPQMGSFNALCRYLQEHSSITG